MIGLLGALARAQEPAEPPVEPEGPEAHAEAETPAEAPDEPPDDSVLEIEVWARRVEEAREAVIGEIQELGYTRKVRRREDRTVFVHEDGWKGKVVLYDDGRLATRRTGPSGRKLDPLPKTRVRPYFLCVIQPTACIRAGSWYYADRRWRQVEDEVARGTAEALVTLGDRMADAATAQTVATLPDRLDRLWREGVPLEGSTPLLAWQDKREALLRYWDSRTETTWGMAVREVVAAFIRGEVQQSEHPYTDEEKARFEAERKSAQPFPW